MILFLLLRTTSSMAVNQGYKDAYWSFPAIWIEWIVLYYCNVGRAVLHNRRESDYQNTHTACLQLVVQWNIGGWWWSRSALRSLYPHTNCWRHGEKQRAHLCGIRFIENLKAVMGGAVSHTNISAQDCWYSRHAIRQRLDKTRRNWEEKMNVALCNLG